MRKVFFFTLVLFSCFSTSAQWTANTLLNTEVSSTVTGDSKTIATSDGKTWFAYFKSVPSPNNYEVRAQLLDKDGVKLLGPEGMLVNNTPHPTFTTIFAATIDAANNLVVAFANASTSVVYVNKVSPAGTQLWSSSGVSFPGGIAPKLGVLTNGDIIVSWVPSSGTKAPMQRLDAATGTPVWSAPVMIQTVNAAHRSAPGHIYPVSGNGFIHVFHNRATTSISSTLWAQKYDAAGVAQWAAPIQITNKTTAYNTEYSQKSSGDTAFLGYYGSTGLRLDSYVQRINPDGTMPWGINGIDFATDNNYYEMNTYISIDAASNVVWASSKVTNTSQGSQGTYVQKFNKTTGARLFTDNAKIVFPVLAAPQQVTPLGISLFSDKNPLLLVGRYNSAISQFLYATKLDNNGNFVWAGDSIALARYPASKLRMALGDVVGDQAVAGWVENRGTVDQPYAQPIRINGATGLQSPVAAFTASPRSACINSPIQFTSTATGFVAGYNWSFPGGTPSTSTAANPTVTYSNPGVFNVSLVASNAGGSNTSTQTNYITIFSNPQISAGPDKTIINGDPVTLEGSGIANPATLAWTPSATLTGANTYKPVARTGNSTVYTLTVKDNNGCTSTDNMQVTVIPYCVKVMSAFTPNGDGFNDRWLVTNGALCSKQIIAKVFNRYGDLVYSNDNYNNDWDGRYKGKAVADGTYYYTLEFRLINGTMLPLKGDVTILR